MRIPISVKIILLTLAIVISATFLITKQSSEYLKSVMVQREDYGNLTEAGFHAGQVESALNATLDRALALSSEMINKSVNNGGSDDQIKSEFEKNKFLVSFQIYRVNAGLPERVAALAKDSFLKKLNVPETYFDDLVTKRHFPIYSVVQKNRELQVLDVTPAKQILTLGFAVGKDSQDQVTYLALATFDADMLHALFNGESERDFYLVDRSGVLLAHQGDAEMKILDNISEYPIVKKALADAAPVRQFTFQDPKTNKTFIGAYTKIPSWGVSVFAQTAQDIVLEPAQEVQKKSIFIFGIVTSVALFVCFLFSLTLTGPIEKLAELIQEIKKGNFDVRAREQVKTHDEVGDLATAFDEMTGGLRERDKVKNILNKFHGSTVAESLIANEVSVGGTRKPVTVFFSDIRGFTKFSEGHTAEEVVTMLNEYFAVMVSIINRRGGVVDKFIGDAIMAVWGVPNKTDRDTFQAVTACIEMRTALNELNEKRLARGLNAITIGMGLHSGDAISGTVGSEDRMEYTVIGDTVNMASRIEAATKAFGTDFLISETVFEAVKDEFGLEFAGAAEVKGKSQPLKMFKAIGYKNANGEIEIIKTPYSEYAAGDVDKVKLAV